MSSNPLERIVEPTLIIFIFFTNEIIYKKIFSNEIKFLKIKIRKNFFLLLKKRNPYFYYFDKIVQDIRTILTEVRQFGISIDLGGTKTENFFLLKPSLLYNCEVS